MTELAPRILMSIHQGFSARYLLRTDVLGALLNCGARIVVISPFARDPSFVEQFTDSRISFDCYDEDAFRRYAGSPLQRLFTEIRLYGVNSSVAVDQKRRRSR